MKLAITGHRPNKLNNEYNLKGPVSDYLRRELTRILISESPTQIITGMALGVDTLYALLGIELKIPVLACIPCKDHDSKWVPESKRLYKEILSNPLVTTHLVTNAPYSVVCMQERNKYLVGVCDKLIAVYDGSPGGTGNCVAHAIKTMDKNDIIYVDPRDYKKPVEVVQTCFTQSPKTFEVSLEDCPF